MEGALKFPLEIGKNGEKIKFVDRCFFDVSDDIKIQCKNLLFLGTNEHLEYYGNTRYCY
jgi:hypothetical protein